MTLTQEDQLKEKAHLMFEPDVAEQVIMQIEQEFKDAKKSETVAPTDSQPFISIATLGLSDMFYRGLSTGILKGIPTLAWNNMDEFILLQNGIDSFSYETSKGRVITPKSMKTDGGTIPSFLRGLKKYSPWGYAPAFLIHDWLFVAKKCGDSDDGDFSFKETAEVMAECMKTMMEVGYLDYSGKQIILEKSEDTLWLMYLAVRSFVAKELWEKDETASCLL